MKKRPPMIVDLKTNFKENIPFKSLNLLVPQGIIDFNTGIDLNKKITLLKSISLFAGLAPLELQNLADLSQELCFKSGQIIVAEGSLIESIFIIEKGNVELSFQNSRVSFVNMSSGEIIGLNEEGELPIISTKYFSTAKANDKVSTVRLSLNELHDFLRQHIRKY